VNTSTRRELRVRERRANGAQRQVVSRYSPLMPQPDLFHVDVFATAPLTGNGLAVFLNTERWSTLAMQRLTQEMRQFESIFLSAISPAGARARVFTVEEELPFAGHPVLGAASVLHRIQAPAEESRFWELQLPHGKIGVRTRKLGVSHLCEMNQGRAVVGSTVSLAGLQPILSRLSLEDADLIGGIDAQVISTGLPYLIVPVGRPALANAKIIGADLEVQLQAFAAKFVLLLAVEDREMRTWDNLGRVEDVATGSAAGPAAAYLWNLGLAGGAGSIELAQGRYAGRPSKITVVRDQQQRILVSGEVWPVSHGFLEVDQTAMTA
jgi:trans-2,3-dihydro-3-hydroxyanthranilate isomerase